MHLKPILAVCATAGLLFGASAPASALTVSDLVVLGSSDIFRVGGEDSYDGTDPTVVNFAAGAGQTLSLAGVTGTVTCCTGSAVNGGPDGDQHLYNTTTAGYDTDVLSARGISGGSYDGAQGFLVGVFVNSAALPVSGAPTALDFTDLADDASFAPELNQSFFIGDGLTGTGSGDTQLFAVPDAADMLVLGLLDSGAFVGAPDFYSDNVL